MTSCLALGFPITTGPAPGAAAAPGWHQGNQEGLAVCREAWKKPSVIYPHEVQ